MNTARRSRNRCSADWQSAVSPAGSRPGGAWFDAREKCVAPAGCQPATQQAASRRNRETLRAGTARAPKSSRGARILLLRRPPSNRQSIAAAAWLLGPEGRRRRLAGGKPAPAGAAPGGHAERAMPQRGIGEVFGVGPPTASPPPLVASGRWSRQRSSGIPGHFFDAPLGHGAARDGFRGRRPLPRTCPRLISSGIPPGRNTVRSRAETGNQWRGNGVPNSFGCGFAARCSSCLRGRSRLSRLKNCAEN